MPECLCSTCYSEQLRQQVLEKQEANPNAKPPCQCIECNRPDPHPWACKYRFIAHLEDIPIPGRGTLSSSRAHWEGELRKCIAARGEQSLASVAYALRLAQLLAVFDRPEESCDVYRRFLAPRLLDERRRDELLGAASLKMLSTHASAFGIAVGIGGDYALSRTALVAALGFWKRIEGASENSLHVADLYWMLAKSCVKIREKEDALNYFLMAAKTDRDSGDAQRLGSRCCIPNSIDHVVELVELYIAAGGIQSVPQSILQVRAFL
eukprot:tig00021357_g20796.t1